MEPPPRCASQGSQRSVLPDPLILIALFWRRANRAMDGFRSHLQPPDPLQQVQPLVSWSTTNNNPPMIARFLNS